jgi:hypothetical protein
MVRSAPGGGGGTTGSGNGAASDEVGTCDDEVSASVDEVVEKILLTCETHDAKPKIQLQARL